MNFAFSKYIPSDNLKFYIFNCMHHNIRVDIWRNAAIQNIISVLKFFLFLQFFNEGKLDLEDWVNAPFFREIKQSKTEKHEKKTKNFDSFCQRSSLISWLIPIASSWKDGISSNQRAYLTKEKIHLQHPESVKWYSVVPWQEC